MSVWLVHVNMVCQDCGKEFQTRNGQGLAAQHAKKYGHRVEGEIGLAARYGPEKKEKERPK